MSNIIAGLNLNTDASRFVSASRGLDICRRQIADEKKDPRPTRNWRRRTHRIERKFRSVVDSMGRKGDALVLDFMVGLAVFRTFKDGEGVACRSL